MESITYEESLELKRKLKNVNKLECNHNKILKEYFGGTHSDYICADCGYSSTILSDFRKKPSK